MIQVIHCSFTVNYTQALKSQMSKYVTLQVLQFTLTQKEERLGGGCDVCLSLVLDPARPLNLTPKCVLCMVNKVLGINPP